MSIQQYENTEWYKAAKAHARSFPQLKKMVEHRVRNMRTNAHLWEEGKTFGYDYVTCPIMGTRMSMLRTDYIEKILNMTIEEYDSRFPDYPRVSTSRKENISAGLQRDTGDGETAGMKATKKRVENMSRVGEDGLTAYQKLGRKTRATHMSRIDENGLNGYNRIAKVARPKQNATMASQGKRAAKKESHEWKSYLYFVHWLTKEFKKQLAETTDIKLGLAGTPGAYQVDHIYPIVLGFHNGVSPFVIAHEGNIQVIPWEENTSKSAAVPFSVEQLLTNTGISKEENDRQYALIMSIIRQMDKRSSIEMWEKYCEANNGKEPPL